MKLTLPPRAAWLLLPLFFAACSHYATVKETRLSYEAETPAGEMIAGTLKKRRASAQEKLGGYMDAAAEAAKVLRSRPEDKMARADYNFALSRIMEVVNEAGLNPAREVISCEGAGGGWEFTLEQPDKPVHQDLSCYRIIPADRYEFKGRLVKDRTVKEGLGAPLVVTSRGFDPVLIDPFAQGRSIYYGMTAVAEFKGRECRMRLLDPLNQETVTVDGKTHALAADFTAPIGLALAELKPRKAEIQRFLKPKQFEESTRLARLQPYDAKKIPILCIHGLGDSQATWAPMIETLRGDATIRQNYQIWFYSYPTGYPYPLMAAVLRDKLDEIGRYYPGHKPIVVIGHSMGGMIARTLITDTGRKIWDAYFDQGPDELPMSETARELLRKSLIFRPRSDVSRVIFASASLGGADMATGFVGRLGRRIIGSPTDLADMGKELAMLAKPHESGTAIKRAPNSIDVLDPENRFVRTINEIPPVRSVPYHSIIGDRGKGGNRDRTEPISTDGIVPYWSSHIDGAASELIVPSGHWSNQHPAAIAEVRRILLEHAGR